MLSAECTTWLKPWWQAALCPSLLAADSAGPHGAAGLRGLCKGANRPSVAQRDSPARTLVAGAGETPATAGEASLSLDVTDERLAAFTQPRQADAPNPLVAPLAASGPYYGTALLFLYGAYLTTTPEYIANTGINYWQGILN